jgi:ubiquinone/menaquinone biosynthesis C-methylase UbiE
MFGKIFHGYASKYSWDTRCRNSDVASQLSRVIGSNEKFLDAGCGENMLGALFSKSTSVGLDVSVPRGQSKKTNFVLGSIVELPFGSKSIPYITSVDVLEHLPVLARVQAVRELVRVASKGIVVACPFNGDARKIDEEFHKELSGRRKEIPEWLTEHLAQPYPEIEEIVGLISEEASKRGSRVATRIDFSEHLPTTKVLRWMAARSTLLYMITNITLGTFEPLLWKVERKGNSYRMIVTAIFDDIPNA